MRSIAAVVLVLLVVSCGTGSRETTQAAPSASTDSPASSPALSGPWKEKPGQADDVEKALSEDGYDCTRHAGKRVDLRMCGKSTPPPAEGRAGASASLRFMADGKGTIVRAAVTASSDTEGRKLRTQLLKSVMPEEDVAIVEAGGTKITWGTAAKRENATYLVILDGQAASDLVEQPDLGMFKEQALPKLQAAGLRCTVENEDTQLKCFDPNRKGDGLVGATLTDKGVGIKSISISASQQDTPLNAAEVKKLAPSVLSLSDDLADVRKWVESHLDGRTHSAYVGRWGVSVSVGLSPMFGDSVSVSIGAEKDDLGATPAR